MWILEQLAAGIATQATDVIARYWLAASASTITLGRPLKSGAGQADIVIHDDSSISKVHCALVVEPGAGAHAQSVLKLEDMSRFGTFVNGGKCQARQGDKLPVLKAGDILRLGSPRSTFRLRFEPFIVLLLGDLAASNVATSAARAGMQVVSKWNASVTHTVVEDGATLQPEVMATLLAGRSLVTAAWVHQVAGSKVHVGSLPDVSKHMPATATVPGGAHVVLSAAFEGGRQLLQGLHFSVVPGDVRSTALQYIVELLGGSFLECSKTADSRSIRLVQDEGDTDYASLAMPALLAMILRHDRVGLATLAVSTAAGGADQEDSDMTQPLNADVGTGEEVQQATAATPSQSRHREMMAIAVRSPTTRSSARNSALHNSALHEPGAGALAPTRVQPQTGLGKGKRPRAAFSATPVLAPADVGTSGTPAAKRQKQISPIEEGGTSPSVFGAPTQLQPLDVSRLYSQQVAAQQATQLVQDQQAAPQKQIAGGAKGKGGRKMQQGKEVDLISAGRSQGQQGGGAGVVEEAADVHPIITYAPLLVQKSGTAADHALPSHAAAAPRSPRNYKAFRKAGQGVYALVVPAAPAIILKPRNFFIKTAEADAVHREDVNKRQRQRKADDLFHAKLKAKKGY